ncbi:CBN-TAG-261 protein [Caenorhabditis brenneri]|uniref:CBN-TAG-261 protein n=1 Tax=Caenorhabditis brenneri TaxID=135651 RepID=G0NYC5_CAEBE|nr:CBN-TAG-261 protein [Caenorhabditis brenneri]
MSSRSAGSYDEITQYIQRLREERKLTESSIRKMEKEKSDLSEKIDELTTRRSSVEARLQAELERAERQDKGLKEAESTHAKLLESQKMLVDFVRKEYQDTKHQKY